MPEYLNWALTGFTSLAWWVIYVCALNWKERNTASKSAKDVVDTRSTVGYQSLPRHYCCRPWVVLPLLCFPWPCHHSRQSMVELPSCPPSKTGGKGQLSRDSLGLFLPILCQLRSAPVLASVPSVGLCCVFKRDAYIRGKWGHLVTSAVEPRKDKEQMICVRWKLCFSWLNMDEWRKRRERKQLIFTYSLSSSRCIAIARSVWETEGIQVTRKCRCTDLIIVIAPVRENNKQ